MNTAPKDYRRYIYHFKLSDLFRGGVHFLFELIKPKSRNEDLRRREFILNVLLLGSIALSVVANAALIINFIKFGSAHRGGSPFLYLFILALFVSLYILSRRGFFIWASYIFVGVYFAACTNAVYLWGIDLPVALLAYALIIIMASILVSIKFGFVATLIISFVIILFGYLQNNFLIKPDLYWKKEMLHMDDAVVIAAIFAVTMIISWLSNREIEKSLQRARRSEAELKKERDSLEVRVEERTAELKKLQLEKTLQLYRFAEFGRMASGVFHDLINPLTVASLNLEDLKNKEDGKLINEEKESLDKIINAIEHVKKFLGAARKQIQSQEINIVFSLADEILLAIKMISYKARKLNVKLDFSPPDILIQTYGNPVKFYQLVVNLMSNAIDAYENLTNEDDRRRVEIELLREGNMIFLFVRDWGCGVKPEYKEKIFQPLFTTKGHDKGVGIGLTICKEIIEKDFGGSIKIESREGEGSVFAITLPVRPAPFYE